MKTTSQYFPEFFALLKQLGIKTDDERHELIYDFTDGRTSSSKDLTEVEMNLLITRLRRQSSGTISAGFTPRNDAANKMRRKIISMAYQIGWTERTPNGDKADMLRINGWCHKFGYLHKPLNDYALPELPRLVTQFENMYNDVVKGMN